MSLDLIVPNTTSFTGLGGYYALTESTKLASVHITSLTTRPHGISIFNNFKCDQNVKIKTHFQGERVWPKHGLILSPSVTFAKLFDT